MRTYDAVVVGAGHNGLAASVMLASAGWSVLVLERNEAPGGAVRTEEVTLPGFRHDLFATNMNLFAGSPFAAEFGEELARHGLTFARCEKPFGSVFPGDRFIGVSTDEAETLRTIEAVAPEDLDAWTKLAEWFGAVAPHIFPLLGTSIPSVKAAKALFRGSRVLGATWPLDLARLVLQSSRQFTEEHFSSPEVRALCASWGMHLDLPPDAPGGALFSFLETFASNMNGMVLAKGGASAMIDALVAVLEGLGGQIELATPVTQVVVEDGKASSVEVASGERVAANRAVIANLTPKVLFGPLVPESALPVRFLERVDAFAHGPGGLMVHLAMDDLPDWRAGDHVKEWGYVHIGPYMEDMTLAYQRAVAGLLPERPMLIVGQPTAVDPSRAPRGKHVLWVQVRFVPSEIEGDAAGEIKGRDWETVREAYADRVLAIIEEYAPGTSDKVLGRHVLTPDDLEDYNPNLIGGDSLGGSHHPMQFAGLRPFPGWTKYRTPIDRLYMCGASTWPGAGLGAGSGYQLGKELTRTRNRIPGMGSI
jgi:phytoene dehydrogenase-like protein